MVESTYTISKREFECFEKTSGLVLTLKDMKDNPGNGHSSKKLVKTYGDLVNEYGHDMVQEQLRQASISTGFVDEDESQRVGEFLQFEYDEMLKRENIGNEMRINGIITGSAKDVECPEKSYDIFINHVAGEHQAHNFKPGETGTKIVAETERGEIKVATKDDMAVFRDFTKKSEHETRRFFSIGERHATRRDGSKTYLAPFDS